MEQWQRDMTSWYPEFQALRHRLHQEPECPFQEHRTTQLIRELLTDWGAVVEDHPGLDTGLTALIHGAHPGPIVALREDIDALPMSENTGLPFSSCREGICHACGHDIHTAALLWAAKALCGLRDRLHGSVKLIFQCAEEVGAGAERMLALGALGPDRPEAVVGFHCDPKLPWDMVGLRYGPSNASFDILTWHITGQGGHGAYPQQCVDPVMVSGYLLTQLQTVISRVNSPTHPAVLTIGEIHGGTAPNIIPDQVTMRGTMRAFDPAIRQQLLDTIRRITTDGCRALGAEGVLVHDVGTPAIHNHPDIADRVARAVEETFGREHLQVIPEPSLGSDDFACWIDACGGRGVQFLVGSHDPQLPNSSLGLHVAENIFVDECLKTAAPVLVRFALDYLSSPRP
ncbi:MAG: amidohydrolase [Oscillospiraceae bacterium]|jgi:amidohydrolase|nr:amidohydrolase [Oscillospiraceae bacterium]